MQIFNDAIRPLSRYRKIFDFVDFKFSWLRKLRINNCDCDLCRVVALRTLRDITRLK